MYRDGALARATKQLFIVRDVCDQSILNRKAMLLGRWTTSRSLTMRLHQQRRQLLPTSYLHSQPLRNLQVLSILYPPATFLGLVVVLWIYKCLIMIIFQNKIIYMPYVPPFSRSEKIAEYASLCLPVIWREERFLSRDGTRLACAIGQLPSTTSPQGKLQQANRTVVIYFHGNGGSVPSRLPNLSAVLKRLRSPPGQVMNQIIIIALSYRGYWTSAGRASEKGLKLDADAALLYAHEQYPDSNIVLWGQSLGAAAALHTASKQRLWSVSGLILETPFVSIRAMLTALYPQSWLPYRYLGPFLWNHWDSVQTLQSMDRRYCNKALILQGGKDELVPQSHMNTIASAAKSRDLDVKALVVRDALHNDVTGSHEGRVAIAAFVEDCFDNAK